MTTIILFGITSGFLFYAFKLFVRAENLVKQSTEDKTKLQAVSLMSNFFLLAFWLLNIYLAVNTF